MTLDALLSAVAPLVDAGASGSTGSDREADSAAVEGVGADTRARGRRIDEGYEGALKRPFGFFSFDEEGGGCDTDGVVRGM